MKHKKYFIILIIILICIALIAVFKNEILKIIYPKKYNEEVIEFSTKYNVDSDLVFAVIKSESNFNPNIISNKGAIGLMQIMEETAKDITTKFDIKIDENSIKQELLNPKTNINIGTKYLEILLNKYNNNITLALTAYNAGSGNVDKWIEQGIIKADGSDAENIPYKETNNYVRCILRDYDIYKDIYK